MKTAVALGELVQTKGKGASCSFKLPAAPARGRRAASVGPRKMKQRAAKTKAMLAIKAAETREKKKRTSPAKPKKCQAREHS